MNWIIVIFSLITGTVNLTLAVVNLFLIRRNIKRYNRIIEIENDIKGGDLNG